MAILRNETRAFGARTFRLTLESTTVLPPAGHISTAHCLGFDGDGRFLLTRHVERQWTIPGGHLEPGEGPEDAMRRETIEEAAATVADPVVIAAERIELVDGEPDPRYPIPSFQVFFLAHVVDVGALVANAECVESGLFAVPEARALPGWMDHNGDLFDVALDAFQARRGRTSPSGHLTRVISTMTGAGYWWQAWCEDPTCNWRGPARRGAYGAREASEADGALHTRTTTGPG